MKTLLWKKNRTDGQKRLFIEDLFSLKILPEWGLCVIWSDEVELRLCLIERHALNALHPGNKQTSRHFGMEKMSESYLMEKGKNKRGVKGMCTFCRKVKGKLRESLLLLKIKTEAMSWQWKAYFSSNISIFFSDNQDQNITAYTLF